MHHETPHGPPGRRSFLTLAALAALSAPGSRVLAQAAPEREIACGETVSGSTRGLPDTWSVHDCGVVLSDGEVLHPFDHPGGTVGVVFSPVVDRTWVLLYDESLTACLGQGPRGLAVPDLPPGRYVVVVDGFAGGGSDYELRLTCDARVDTATARPIGCGQAVAGDTTGRPSTVDAHPCVRDVLAGGEEVLRFDNPMEQAVRARLVASQPGQRLIAYDESGQCLPMDALGLACSRRRPGPLYLVVDGSEDGPFEVDVTCSGVIPGTDLQVTAIDRGRLVEACDADGVAGTVDVSVANVGEADAAGPVEVVLFDDAASLDGALGPTDAVLGRAVLPALRPGEIAAAPIAVDAFLPFREAPLHAVVDPADAVPETDETNNTWSTARACRFRPASEELRPVVEWHWSGSAVLPEMDEVDTTPLVADLDGDGLPEVIVVTGVDEANRGVVRALRGSDGSEVWTAESPVVYSSSNIAVGDLDGDPGLEVVAQGFMEVGIAAPWLEAFDSDGTHLWTSAGTGFPTGGRGGGAPSLADLDCDGLAEVVFGRVVYRGIDGERFWDFEDGGTVGSNGLAGPLSVPVDVDLDGTLEVVAGRTCYKWNGVQGAGSLGEILWNATLLPDGNVAVGQFDADDEPEIVLVGDGSVSVLEGESGALKWRAGIPLGGGPLCVPRELAGGPPTVADFDGDCLPEIGVGGADWYSVFETDGTLKWKAPIDDCSSHRTASTVFDFDADGAVEVVYLDETNLHVFAGRTGEEIVSIPAASHTWIEMVSIADVDADGNAEIVVPLNPCLLQPRCDALRQGLTGVQVIGDAEDSWVGTRGTWNQHAYHVDNVLDDGRVAGAGGTPCAPRPWETHGTFRNQLLPTAELVAPDLTVSILASELVDLGSCERAVDVVTRVGNAGSEVTPAGVEVRLYNADPDAGGVQLGDAVLGPLAPGEATEFSVRLRVPWAGEVELHAVVDDDGDSVPGGVRGRVSECREDNNRCVALVVPGSGDPGAPPSPVGDALRVRDHGPGGEATVRAVLDWSLDAGAPRDPGAGDHFHLLAGDDPARLQFQPGLERLSGSAHLDETPAAASTPAVRYLRVVAVDGCETAER